MSNFYCEQCGMPIIDSSRGCITGCRHYPAEVPDRLLTVEELSLKHRTENDFLVRDAPETD